MSGAANNKNSLEILDEKIELLRSTAISMKQSGKMDETIIEGLLHDVVRHLYDVYVDENAYVYVPYVSNMPGVLSDEDSVGYVAFTVSENKLPPLHDLQLEEYRKEKFSDVVDYVYKNIEHLWLCLNPGTYYVFDIYDWNLEYIMARKNGAERFPLREEDGTIYGYLTW